MRIWKQQSSASADRDHRLTIGRHPRTLAQPSAPIARAGRGEQYGVRLWSCARRLRFLAWRWR
jgi:hypothetical protein